MANLRDVVENYYLFFKAKELSPLSVEVIWSGVYEFTVEIADNDGIKLSYSREIPHEKGAFPKTLNEIWREIDTCFGTLKNERSYEIIVKHPGKVKGIDYQ